MKKLRDDKDGLYDVLKTLDQADSSVNSRSKMACCFLSSRAMPWLSSGDRRRSMTLASSSRFLASVFLCFRLLGFARSLEQLMPLRVDALPIRALDLDPMAARAARIARLPALGNDALEPDLGAVIEQDLAVGKRFDPREEGRGRVAVQPMQVALALR
jgi:hypothetical protein